MTDGVFDPREYDEPPPQRAGRVPPHNLDAEASLLGAMLLSSDAISAAIQIVSIDDFYKPAHAHVFDAITSLYAQGEPADPITVAEELKRANLLDSVGGPGALVDLESQTPATSNAAYYARIIEERAMMRKLIAVGGEVAQLGYDVPDDVDKAVDTAESLVFRIAERRITVSVPSPLLRATPTWTVSISIQLPSNAEPSMASPTELDPMGRGYSMAGSAGEASTGRGLIVPISCM